jgi:membrane protease YdiL (CAAX protease family)
MARSRPVGRGKRIGSLLNMLWAMRQILMQLIFFSVIGVGIYGLSKLLRCRFISYSFDDAKKSSLQAILAVAVSMIILFILILRQYIQHGPTPGSIPKLKTASDLLPQLLCLLFYGAPAAYCMFRGRERPASAGISKHNLWQAFVIGLVLAALACCNRPAELPAKISNLSVGHWITLIYFSMVGFGEEFLFRGYLQTRLVTWLGRWRGWVFASVIMAIVHLPHRWLIQGMGIGEAALATLTLIPVSLLMGFIMLRTQNIIAPALFHTFANWASQVL